jgi:chromosome segregation ATPase
MSKATLAILTVLCVSLALADDFKTIDGKEYKNVTVKRVEPDGIVVSSKSGISKVYFTELPKAVQQRYGYDPGKASAYTAEQSAALEQARKQREEASRQKAEATAREYQYLAEQQSAREFAKSQQDRVQALQASYQKLQQEEDALLSQIGEAERRHWNDSYRTQLPLLEGHLRDVRHNKAQVRQQLEQLQR